MIESTACTFHIAGTFCWLLCSLAAVGFSNGSLVGTDFHDGVKSPFYREAIAKRSSDVMMTKRTDDANPLEKVVQQQAEVIQTMQAQVNALTNDVINLKNQAAKAVAFSVRFSADPITDVGVGAIVRFDRALGNLGGSYNVQTGMFTAPTPGVYVFFLSLMGSDTLDALELGIVKSGGSVLDIAWVEGKSDIYDQGSCLVTTHLAAGQQVWVKHVAGSTAFRGGLFTNFSGFLIHADA